MTVQILPFDAGGGPAWKGRPLYGKGVVTGMVLIEERERVRTYTLPFEMLTQLALSRAEPLEMINGTAKGYE
ncbi:MAG: hypothetical protein ACRDRH_18790 [Pseudonocardia sp.]